MRGKLASLSSAAPTFFSPFDHTVLDMELPASKLSHIKGATQRDF